jgi:hypothetical protein
MRLFFKMLRSLVAVVNFQVSVLKILAGYPTRLATLRELKRDLSLLATSGKDWSDLTSRLAAGFPKLDIFALGLVERYSFGWRLTHKGLLVLEMMENEAKAGLTGGAPAIERPSQPPPLTATTRAERSSAERTTAEPPVFAMAVGADASNPTAAVVSSRPTASSPAERRSKFAVVSGGKS